MKEISTFAITDSNRTQQMKIKPEDCAKYEINPLVEVVAQFRFAPILQVANEGPVLIQEQLADAGFPNLRKEESASISVTFSSNSGQAVNANQVGNPGCIYHFGSVDMTCAFAICSDFVAFSTSSYSGWTAFQEDLAKLVTVFSGAYKPIMVGRIGLRYKDLIERESLGLAGTPWSDLLNPIVSGFFSTTDFVEEVDEISVEQQTSQTLIQLSDCKLLLQSALLRSIENDRQQAVLIDSDFFVEASTAVSVQDAIAYLDKLHVNANSVFRKCIKDPLHAALRPL